MKLLTKELIKRFREVGYQENVKDPIVVARFFNPIGRGDWFATEYGEDEQVFFGYMSLFGDWNDEFGTFSLYELENIPLPMGLKIERDLYFEEKPLSKCISTFTPLE